MIGLGMLFQNGEGERLSPVMLGALWFLAAIGYLAGTAGGITTHTRYAARHRDKEPLFGSKFPYAIVVMVIVSTSLFATAIHNFNFPDNGQKHFAIGLMIGGAFLYLTVVQFAVIAIARWSLLNLMEVAEERKELTAGLERP